MSFNHLCIVANIFTKENMSLQEIMVYLIRKLNQVLVILTFGQFDHLVILDKLICTHPI
jgi:hypothetical protein